MSSDVYIWGFLNRFSGSAASLPLFLLHTLLPVFRFLLLPPPPPPAGWGSKISCSSSVFVLKKKQLFKIKSIRAVYSWPPLFKVRSTSLQDKANKKALLCRTSVSMETSSQRLNQVHFFFCTFHICWQTQLLLLNLTNFFVFVSQKLLNLCRISFRN